MPGAVVLANMLLVTFFGSLLFNIARGLDINCGCFSTSTEHVEGTTMAWYVLRDSGFLLLGGHLLFRLYIDNARRQKEANQYTHAGFFPQTEVEKKDIGNGGLDR